MADFFNNVLEFIKTNLQIILPITASVLLLLIVFVIILFVKHRKRARAEKRDLERLADLDGRKFEEYCADLLEENGFSHVELTPASSDFGVDIFAEKESITYAIQCKLYDRPVGVKAVQEIYAGRDYYHCMVGAVLSNQSYTSGAVKLAETFNVLLWGDDVLASLEDHKGI